MALKALPPRVAPLAGRIKRGSDEHGHDAGREFWRGWYKLARWARLRERVFLRDAYTCQMTGCGLVVPRPIADHITPHRGDPALFWPDSNVQTLCKTCHDGRKQSIERRAHPGG